MNDKREISEMIKDYEDAKIQLERATKEASIAGNLECSARNRVNNLQKEITAYMRNLAQEAPRDSDWKTQGRVAATGI